MAKPKLPEWRAQTRCLGKHRFDDAGLARKVAAQSSKRREAAISAYRCDHRGGWHVGSHQNKTTNDKRKQQP